MKKLIFIFACLFLAVPSQARIIIVDDNGTADFNNIQAAINDANQGDTIIVVDGTYTGVGNRDIDFLGKAITLRSENGPENCIIDCQGSKSDKHRGFHFHSNEDANSIVDGFTITKGWGPIETIDTLEQSVGGGIYCYQSSPKIKNCIIKDNMASNEGSLIVGSGAGIFCNYANTVIIDCLIENNGSLPGVMGPKPAETVVGGGIIIFGGSATVRECIIIGNEAGMGGGVICWESEVTLLNCNINNNIAVSGAGLHLNGNILVSNCTICDNKKHPDCPTCESGGILWPGFGNLMVRNCIVWGNDGNEIQGTGVDVTYSAIKGGYKGTGNINVNPDFADPYNGDYHLKSQAGRWDPNSKSWVVDDVTSPCIDAGNPGCPLGDEPNEPNNVRRNMGAYGGTAEASKSPYNWRSIADMTNDWVVDSNDLKVFVGYWSETGQCIPSDLNRSQFVDFNDFAIFGLQWSYPSSTVPGMTFHVDDCNEEAGLSWLVAAESNEPRFSVWVEGRYIHFEDMMYANCCPEELGLDNQINGNQINLYEIGYGGLCDCMCYFPITATLGPFEDGTYTVEVFDNYGKSLGVVEVTIGGSTGPTIVYEIEDCNQEASVSFTVEPPDKTRFTITVEGPYIHFEDTMVANCCPDELGLEMMVEDNLITIYETEYTPGGCYCICDYPVTATLGPFEDGTYTVEVFDNYGNSLGVVEVTIGQSTGPGITYQIEDCNQEASISFTAELPDKTRFTVTVEGPYVHFEDTMFANCCPDELGLEMTVEDNLITIYETEYTPDGCRCMCNYPVTATLGPFEPGTYTLDVYEDQSGFIGSTTVVIDPPQ